MRCQFVRRQIPAEAEIKKKANEACDDSESEQTPSFMNMDEKQYGFVTPTRDDQEMPEFPDFSGLSEPSSAKQFETIEDETSTLKTSESVGSARNNIKPFFNDNNLDQSEDEDEIDDEICKTIDDSELISPSINIGEEQYGFATPTRDDQNMPEFPNFSDLSESSSTTKQFETIEDKTSTLKTNESVGSARNNIKPFFNDNNLDQSEDEDEVDDEICKTIDDSESISLLVNMDEKQYEFLMLTRDDQEMNPNFSDLSNSISSQQDEMEAIVVDEASTLKSDGIDEPMRIHKKPIICDKNLEESEDEDEMEDEINSDYPENHIDGLLSTCGLSDDSVV